MQWVNRMANVLGIIPLAQSISLASHNVKFSKKKDKDAEDFMKMGVKNIVGANLISETSNFTGSF